MDYSQIIKEQMKTYIDEDNITDLSQYASNLSNGFSDNFTLDKILDATLNGKNIFQDGNVVENLKELFLLEIKDALSVTAGILAVCIIIGLLNNLSSSFGKSDVLTISELVCAIVIIGIAMANFYEIYNMTLSSIETEAKTMEILLPVLITVIISSGKVATGTIMSPMLLGIITFVQYILKTFILPALFFSTVFTLLNCLTEKDYVNQLAKFIRKAALVITGLLLTIVTGVISVQGLIVKTTDSLLLDVTKYSLDNFIPIIGGFTSDTLELFIKCMTSIKNIFGVFGIILIISILLIPIIKTGCLALIYKCTGLLLEPITTSKISKSISEIGVCLVSMGAVLLFSSLIFILFIASILSIGG